MKMIIKTYIPSWWNEGCNELSKNDEIMKSLINKFNDNKLSSIRNPFYSLCKSIVGQQISVAAARAICRKHHLTIKLHYLFNDHSHSDSKIDNDRIRKSNSDSHRDSDSDCDCNFDTD